MFLLATFCIAGQESAYCGIFVIGRQEEKKNKETFVKWRIQSRLVVADFSSKEGGREGMLIQGVIL